jgi:uncharacterized protein (DUF2147 family)
MTRLLCFAVTMGLAIGLSAAADAETFSFTVGGHHITISASRNCYRAGCVSFSIPGIATGHRKHSDDVITARQAAPAKPAPKAAAANAPAPAAIAPAPQIVSAAPPAAMRAAVPPSPPPSIPKLAASDSKEVAAPAPPMPAEPVKIAASEKPAEPSPSAQPITDKPSVERAAQTLPVAPPTVVLPAPEVAKVVDAERDDTPLGDWQTEGKVGAVRIEACGKALCGYLINPSSHAKGESILINMKPRSDSEWRGSIFSRASGNTYNATITLKSANLLRVEACALGHFFCSRNDWTRIIKEPAALATSRDEASEPRS